MHLRLRPLVGLLLLCSPLSSCTTDPAPADLVILNSTVWTGDAEHPSAEAIAVKGDKIVFVGENEAAQEYISDITEVVDASGKFVTPGFIDSHVHFLTGGFRLSSVQLRDASSKEEFAQRIGDFAKTVAPGTWIVGGDWDHSLWGGELPTREWIDDLTRNNPVWVNRLDGHMALANSVALEEAEVTRSVGDMGGGTIERFANGDLTGLFKDNAMSLIESSIPDPGPELQDRALQSAMDYVSAQGVTSVHDMSGWSISYEALKRAKTRGTLRTRVYLAHSIWQWEQIKNRIAEDGAGDEWLKIGALKGFIDGSLGSHTAAFFEPYSDSPSDSGFLVVDLEEFREVVQQADAAGLHPVVHAIGDKAISDLLDVFESVIEENGDRDRRFRVEHAQHMADKDFERYARNDIVASMQPYHAIDDGRWAETYISDRIQTTYAFRTFIDRGVTLAFGSDWFVAPPTPLEGIYAAVTRRTLDDKNPDGWVPEQKISVQEALEAYTINAAYAGFDETTRGSIAPGKLADLVILSDNLLTIDPKTIRSVMVERTIVGGSSVYSAGEE